MWDDARRSAGSDDDLLRQAYLLTGDPDRPERHAPAWAALGGLPARRRAVLVLRYAEGLPDERIADRVGTTPRSVHVDAEAGLLTLGPALAGDRDPGRLVAAALADARRRGSRATTRVRPPVSRPAPAASPAVPATTPRRAAARIPAAAPPTRVSSRGAGTSPSGGSRSPGTGAGTGPRPTGPR